jgi:Uma2 family endonuclease
MSTVHQAPPVTPVGPEPGPGDDPFRYGWRYVKNVKPDGTVDYDQVPLTLEDLLFPEEGDFTVQLESHKRDWVFLNLVFDAQLAGDPSAVVLADCRVDFNLPGVRPLGPDVVVILGVKRQCDWATLDLAAEGAHAVLAVEVTSADTRPNDYGIKKDFYFRAGVQFYVIVDSNEVKGRRKITLRAYRWEPGGYQPMAANERGWLWLPPVRVWLGTTETHYGEKVACFDATGQEIGEYEDLIRGQAEVHAKFREAQARAEIANFEAMEAQAKLKEADLRIQLAELRTQEFQAKLKEADLRIQEADFRAQEFQAKLKEADLRIQEADLRAREFQAKLKEADFLIQEFQAKLKEADLRIQELQVQAKLQEAEYKAALAEVRAAQEAQAREAIENRLGTLEEAIENRLGALEEEMRRARANPAES